MSMITGSFTDYLAYACFNRLFREGNGIVCEGVDMGGIPRHVREWELTEIELGPRAARQIRIEEARKNIMDDNKLEQTYGYQRSLAELFKLWR